MSAFAKLGLCLKWVFVGKSESAICVGKSASLFDKVGIILKNWFYVS